MLDFFRKRVGAKNNRKQPQTYASVFFSLLPWALVQGQHFRALLNISFVQPRCVLSTLRNQNTRQQRGFSVLTPAISSRHSTDRGSMEDCSSFSLERPWRESRFHVRKVFSRNLSACFEWPKDVSHGIKKTPDFSLRHLGHEKQTAFDLGISWHFNMP